MYFGGGAIGNVLHICWGKLAQRAKTSKSFCGCCGSGKVELGLTAEKTKKVMCGKCLANGDPPHHKFEVETSLFMGGHLVV